MALEKYIARRIAAVIAAFVAGPALAADLTVKAPPQPVAAFTPSDIHGFFDVSFGGDYVTPRGVHVTGTGLTTQIDTGLSADVYKNKNGFINKISLYGGVWNDLWSEQNSPTVGSWKEFDWFIGGKVQFARSWIADVQYVEFLFPAGGVSTQRNLQTTLMYDDTSWGLPVQLKPYIRGWYQFSGPSNVLVGKNGDSGYVEFGATPTLDLTKRGLGVIFTAPTWVSVGPKDYWNRGVAGCGTIATPCAASNAGVFSTGLTATVPVTWIPSNFGHWSVRGGFQYYHLMNDSLLLAQTLIGTASSYTTAKRDIAIGFAGLSFNF
jgi:hypothetical protein